MMVRQINLLIIFALIICCNGCFRTPNPQTPFDFCAPEVCILPGGQGPGVQIYPALRDPAWYPDGNCVHHHTVACVPPGPSNMINFDGDPRPITTQIECPGGELAVYYTSTAGIRTPVSAITCP